MLVLTGKFVNGANFVQINTRYAKFEESEKMRWDEMKWEENVFGRQVAW